MAYTLGNKCAKNCCKRTIPVQLILEDVVTCFFFGTQCIISYTLAVGLPLHKLNSVLFGIFTDA